MSQTESQTESGTEPPGDEVIAETWVRRRGSPVVESVEVEGQSVVYDAVHNSLHVLDHIGTQIWARLLRATTVDELSKELSAAYGEQPTAIGADVLEFVRDLDALHLLERVQ